MKILDIAAAAVPVSLPAGSTRGGVSTHSGHVIRLIGTFLDYQMADAVNVSLENTVREAEDLEKSGIFTVSEVKFIFRSEPALNTFSGAAELRQVDT